MTKCTQKCLSKGEGIIIVGRTKDGKLFQPANWAHRHANQIAQHDNAPRYRPCLIPTQYDGIPSLRMSRSIQQCEEHCHMYDVVMRFARWADLEVIEGITPQRLHGVLV